MKDPEDSSVELKLPEAAFRRIIRTPSARHSKVFLGVHFCVGAVKDRPLLWRQGFEPIGPALKKSGPFRLIES